MLQIVADTLAPGTIVPGGFRLERIVGEGGMGVVWAARHQNGRVVALKFLAEGRENDPRNQQRFLREARASMAVVHPNVARVEAVLETDAGVPFMVMELLEGQSLRDWLRQRKTLGPAETASLLIPVVDAVAHAHAMRIVHRDLKPENIFLVPSPYGPQIRVLDFGIAKELGRAEIEATASASLTSTGQMIGTPFYMAPEQVFGESDIDGRVDCWALGIILYECLAGEPPTEAPGFGQILKRITSEPIVPLGNMRPGLPGKITRLVARMLDRNRLGRPALAEVRAVLAEVAAMGDMAGPSAPMTPPIRSPQFHPPHPSATTLGAANTVPAMARPKSSKAPLVIGLVAGLVVLGGAGTAAAILVPPYFETRGPFDYKADIELAKRANDAVQRKDGKECKQLLDQYDKSPNRTTKSTDPADATSVVRATCMMVNGDCEGGKALYKKWVIASKQPEAEAGAEGQAAVYCTGSSLSQRDELLRATNALTFAGSGQKKASVAECKDWMATVKRLEPVVKPKDANDYAITSIPMNIPYASTRCLARAGDCSGALATFKADFDAKNASWTDVKTRDQSMRISYDGMVQETACKGKP